MIPAFCLLVVLAVSATHGQTTPQTPPPRRVRFGSDPTSNSPDPEGEAARVRERFQRYNDARAAFARDDLRVARRVCEAVLSDDPEDSTAACLLADVDFRQNRIGEAYDLITSFVQTRADDVLLRAALASGLCGETHRGMEAYCRTRLDGRYEAATLADSLPELGDRRAEPLCAALALATQAYPNDESQAWGESYYGIALRLDPGNPLANVVLADIDKTKGRWGSARSRLQAASRRADKHARLLIARGLQEVATALKATNPSFAPVATRSSALPSTRAK